MVEVKKQPEYAKASSAVSGTSGPSKKRQIDAGMPTQRASVTSGTSARRQISATVERTHARKDQS
jgi:hypothetical protein